MMTVFKNIIKHFVLFLFGAQLYACIELIASGSTHWSMYLLGGVCFVLLGLINELIPWDWSLTTQALLGALIITTAEFISGCILNLWLSWAIWDYSDKPYNLLGQISAENSFYWFLLSFIGIFLDDWLRHLFFNEEKPRYRL